MQTLTARRVLSGRRRGSSRPVIVETEAGPRLVKLRGAGQGTGALVAEIIVAELAEALDLSVPARSLVTLEPGTPTDDRNDELADLLSFSHGLNLGFEILHEARDFEAADIPRVSAVTKSTILWLDRLVLNPDRTGRNPNLLWCRERPWLIDHGASLRFQYRWSAVTEDSPRTAEASPEAHLFATMAAAPDWPERDLAGARRLTRDVLTTAVDAVPDDFLATMLPPSTPDDGRHEAVRRRRAAYVAWLWKRLKPPRDFARRDGQRG